ncbi:PLP-dependent aminotransferase family protein [Vibrio sp. T187]|uniref:aminotransferase-like domain-containing protein n=1 Tax=Vibrio TaxID=662 RepID=UPI0010C93653|nr:MULTISPECIES: PLP-dependent aminotransferase family protein [Vibrio]MBW3694827.1 PLP-dependent aminotransferase family protein [Vibrio sp. T187]
MTKYQQLAEQIKQQIQQQTWRVGEKIPSVRMSCRNFGLSNSTVLQAYQLLESQGWIVAKPQSGYFVAPRLQAQSLPEHTPANQRKINDLLFDFLKSCSADSIEPFGSAFPDPSLFPLPDLTRNLASAGRKMKSIDVIDNLPPGSEALRRQIAQRYLQQGIAVNMQDIVITSGAMEALNLSLQAVTNSGDVVIVESPAFYGALQAIERLGLTPLEVEVDSTDGLDLEQFELALENNNVAACWLMTTFQNPTGSCLSEEKKQKVVELASKHQVPIIEDDVYGELHEGETRPKPLKFYDQDNLVLLCGSFSKSLCPGYRMGWVVNSAYNDRIQKLQLLSTLSSSAPIQVGVAHYLIHDSYDNHLRKLRKELLARKSQYLAILKNDFPANIKISDPVGGYFFWIEFDESVSTRELYKQGLVVGVGVAPGELFSPGSKFEHCIRLNFSYELTEARKLALKQLGRIAHSL